nr:enth domain-containing protein c19f8.03c [Quercus suber]
MSSSFEKSVKGGTKVKLAAPKAKYVEHILMATQSGEAGVAEVFRTLTHRLRDPTWTISFKALIIVHLLMNEGAQDVTLRYLAVAPKNRLAINSITDVQTQGHNIRTYSDYLLSRVKAYAATEVDYVKKGEGRMKRLTVDKGLLRETELLQDQVKALVRCELLTNEAENDITLAAFRILTGDLLILYNVQNEAVMNVLGKYFEMSRPDAERAIKIYKNFCKQTDAVVGYLSIARQYEHATKLSIPKIRHAPTGLAKSLQEYLDDVDFDTNRRQYLAEQEAQKNGRPLQKSQAAAGPSASQEKAALAAAEASAASSSHPARGPAPDLMDFFESIEERQQPLAQNVPPPYVPNAQAFGMQQPQVTAYPQQQPQQIAFSPQQTGFSPQQQGFAPQHIGNTGFQAAANMNNPFGQPHQQPQQPSQHVQAEPLQTQFTGAGFGGYGPQPQQQQSFATGNAFSPVQTQSPVQQLQPQQTSSNPFRQSSMPTGAANAFSAFAQQDQLPPLPQQHQHQSTNPFARSTQSAPAPGNAFGQEQQYQQQQLSPQTSIGPMPTTLQAQPTGMNPFAKTPTSAAQPQQLGSLQVQPTGSTNPFRQSQFVYQQTGQGWQSAPQATMGGLENLDTVPVFPRPGAGSGGVGMMQQQQQQQQQQHSPWG